MIGGGALKLLQIFLKPTDTVTDRQTNRLVAAFGPFSSATVKQARLMVDRIRNSLPQYDR